jgi:hypothetical protein
VHLFTMTLSSPRMDYRMQGAFATASLIRLLVVLRHATANDAVIWKE